MLRGAKGLRASRQQSGQGLTEYALVLAVMATVVLVGLHVFYKQLNAFYVQHILPYIP